ncbi:MAG TPA: hypothetical protein PLU75_06095 [Oscillospiraceae bacterium]|nr:hypothetical protein [Oscillospiraceae bacterium]
MDFLKEAIIAVVVAVIGSVVTGLYERHRDKKKSIEEKREVQHKMRPEFTIVDMKDSFSRPGTYITSQPCDLEVFVAPFSGVTIQGDTVSANYDEGLLDKKNWVCRQYTFKNIGGTAAYTISIISNYKKGTCIIDKDAFTARMVSDGLLNYWAMLEKRVGPGESFTLKLCYSKDKIVTGMLSAIMSLVICDDNSVYWEQPFFSPEPKLYESKKILYNEYRESISSDAAIECLKKTYL